MGTSDGTRVPTGTTNGRIYRNAHSDGLNTRLQLPKRTPRQPSPPQPPQPTPLDSGGATCSLTPSSLHVPPHSRSSHSPTPGPPTPRVASPPHRPFTRLSTPASASCTALSSKQPRPPGPPNNRRPLRACRVLAGQAPSRLGLGESPHSPHPLPLLPMTSALPELTADPAVPQDALSPPR
ncbi:PREDICTED: formin-like protein 13 [Ceratotherium simum simum]|uniref:Formin-like protein 13 n=1 Tax=Ceratotherium simum simum TaxID=73337 RepID=A0ABM1DJU1_CERSS|nr:PREDICTED: formin-like protein 13 [Ceratotherium simum simum]